MRLILIILILLPMTSWVATLLLHKRREKSIAYVAAAASLLQILFCIAAVLVCFKTGTPVFDEHIFTVYASGHFDFGIQFYFDHLSAVYGILSAFILLIIQLFSRPYMHRENGYKRYYNYLMLFHTGLSILVFSGNFETLFFGWEMIGISSFLLIAFYRERYLPVRNALKVLSFYRLGDVALLCSIWFFHYFTDSSFTFSKISHLVSQGSFQEPLALPFIFSVLLILAAGIKSAQFPFSSWLPRAMEGPTVSSAAFYGSLSVHLGVFLLLRTAPLWQDVTGAGTVIIIMGVITALVSNSIAAVQPTAKTRIAYASATQIGIMFVFTGLGWHKLVLIHLVGHALLRTYQLLISPSAMHYLTHQQIYHQETTGGGAWNRLPERWRDAIYLQSVKEYNMDTFWYHFIWRPLKRTAVLFDFMRKPFWVIIATSMLTFSCVAVFFKQGLHIFDNFILYQFLGLLGLIMVLISWTERSSAIRSWGLVTISQGYFMLSVLHANNFEFNQIVFYLIGIVFAFLSGLFALMRLKKLENGIGLNEFHGHVYEHPRLAALFLVSTLVMIGFPFSPTFLGFDILFSKIGLHQPVLIFTGFFTFIFLELSVLRIYARVFLGQHVKNYHEVAFRNS